MEGRCVTAARFESESNGGFSQGFDSPEESSAEAEDAACYASYVDRVHTAISEH